MTMFSFRILTKSDNWIVSANSVCFYIIFKNSTYAIHFYSTEIDDEVPVGQTCTLFNNFVLQTFSNRKIDGYSFDISEGCERKLVTTCDKDEVDLEIRVDFFKNDFSSTQVAILYKGVNVIIDEKLTVTPVVSPSTEIVYNLSPNLASVSIPEIALVVRNNTALTIFINKTSLPLAGICGDLNEQLLFPDCARKVGEGENLKSFKKSYKLKPSDQMLRGERKECGEYQGLLYIYRSL